MVEFLRAYLDRSTVPDDPAQPMVWVASTEGVKPDGQDLHMEDWSLDRFMRHPVILYAHDYMGHNLPLGTGEPYFEDRKLMMRVNFDTQDEFAMRVRDKAARGMMGGSVGWNATRGADGKIRNELLEFSIVPVPMDDQSLPVPGTRALEIATEYANLELGKRGAAPVSDDALWGHVAAAMAALMCPGCALDDAGRKRVYVALERAYVTFGRTPPEFRTVAELGALGPAELRGLFLEGEWDMGDVRVGAVLSTRNREALSQAMSLIQGVLDSAKKQDDSGGDNKDDEGRALSEMLARLEKIGEK